MIALLQNVIFQDLTPFFAFFVQKRTTKYGAPKIIQKSAF